MNKTSLFWFAATLTLLYTFSGCNSKRKEETVNTSDESSSLIVFTPHKAEMRNFIVKEFRQRTGIKVTLVTGGTRELLSDIENKKINVEGDVFWGGGVESLAEYNHLFKPYVSPQSDSFIEGYNPDDNLWTALSLMPMVIVYNNLMVSENHIPETWTSLLDPYYNDMIRMGNPITSGSSFSVLCTIVSLFGNDDSGWTVIRNLSNVLGENGVTSSSEDVYYNVSSGEALAGLTFEDAIVSLKKQNAPVEIVYPSEGTAVVPEGIALLKTSRHIREAELFIEFVVSYDVQSIVSELWNRRSVRKDVVPPDGTEKFKTAVLFPYPLSKIAGNRDEIIERWKAVRENSK